MSRSTKKRIDLSKKNCPFQEFEGNLCLEENKFEDINMMPLNIQRNRNIKIVEKLSSLSDLIEMIAEKIGGIEGMVLQDYALKDIADIQEELAL